MKRNNLTTYSIGALFALTVEILKKKNKHLKNKNSERNFELIFQFLNFYELGCYDAKCKSVLLELKQSESINFTPFIVHFQHFQEPMTLG